MIEWMTRNKLFVLSCQIDQAEDELKEHCKECPWMERSSWFEQPECQSKREPGEAGCYYVRKIGPVRELQIERSRRYRKLMNGLKTLKIA